MFRNVVKSVLLLGLLGAGTLKGAELSVGSLVLDPGTTGTVVVSGNINAEQAMGLLILVEIVPRTGSLGTVEFTPAPPVDIVQVGDPWPGRGTFTPFDSEPPPTGTGSPTLNGNLDDNGLFQVELTTFSGALTSFPVTTSADAAGVWDVVLSTTAGNSRWDGQSGALPTVLTAGTITVTPSVSLAVNSFAMPPGATVGLDVSGTVQNGQFFGVTIRLELLTRPGNTGTVTFTPAPPVDITQIGDPWPGLGTFNGFDTDVAGVATINASVDDNGSFTVDPLNPLNFAGLLTRFPVTASIAANGVWDVSFSTFFGSSGWDGPGGVPTALLEGTITVSPTACVVDLDCDDANSCTTEVCNAGVCEFTNVVGACDDGNACTVGDTCVSGLCQSGTPADCSMAGDQCNTATCDVNGLVEGNCAILTPVVDGTVCDDGNVCNIGETCQLGVCTGSVPVDCSTAGDQCNTATCDVNGVVEGNCAILTPVADGTVCNDGNVCNTGETCQLGVCTGSVPVDCSAAGDQCNVASCDVTGLEGNCGILTPVLDGTACLDADVCNVGETCQLGVCAGGAPVNCSAVGGPCDVASCDPLGTEGNCAIVNTLPDGAACDDGLFCTATDLCAAGVCVGSGNPCPTGICNEFSNSCADCATNVDCDDGNPCTSGVCVVTVCVQSNVFGPCEDGNPCTQGDTCGGGLCQPGNPVNCTGAGNACNTASCDPLGLNGNCAILTPVMDGTVCDDGDVCTFNDACLAGTCGGLPVDCTSLSDTCNVGICEPQTGVCRKIPFNNGGVCNDGLPCTINDMCSGGICSGTLTAPPSVDLSWSPATTTVQVGQTIQVNLVATSSTCVDQPVGSIEVIANWDPLFMELLGATIMGPSPWSSAGFPDDSALDGLNADCGPALFCNPYTGKPFNDGEAIYQAFADFQVGVSIPPTGLIVTTFEFKALNGTTGVPLQMTPVVGAFSHSRVLGAGPLAGQDITGTLGLATVGISECLTNLDCDDGNVCTTDVCTAGVCGFSNNLLPCNDGLFCTAVDTCSGGVCVGSGTTCAAPLLCNDSLDACVQCLTGVDCADGNPCTDDLCDAAGSCVNSNNTLPCNDGLFCTATDVCSGGVCVGSGNTCVGVVCDEANNQCVQCLTNLDCDDGNVCTDDSCNLNACSNLPNTLPCNDGLFCTSVDTCSGGACVGSGDPCAPPALCSEQFDRCVQCLTNADCDDGNFCTTDTCAFGVCSNTNNTLPCDDGLFCTATDVCSGGVCVGSGTPCPLQLCDEAGSRCVDCFTVADCPDDGVVCTVDACTAGACTHQPDNTLCDDGLFCNGTEFCDPTAGCLTPGPPCDDPALCDEVANLCGCQEPIVVAEGSRYLAVTPRPGTTPVAIKVTGFDPEVACVSLFVQPNGTLFNTPVFKPPSGPGGWGTVHVRGIDIRPDTTYLVQTECDTGQGPGLSTSAFDKTWLWADANNSGGLVDILDLVFILDGFKGNFAVISLYNVDLWGATPESCLPQGAIDVFDLTRGVDAFKGKTFPCGVPCP